MSTDDHRDALRATVDRLATNPSYVTPADGYSPRRDDPAGTEYVLANGAVVRLIGYDTSMRAYHVRFESGKTGHLPGFDLTPRSTYEERQRHEQELALVATVFGEIARDLLGGDLVTEVQHEVAEAEGLYPPVWQHGWDRASGSVTIKLHPVLAARMLQRADEQLRRA